MTGYTWPRKFLKRTSLLRAAPQQPSRTRRHTVIGLLTVLLAAPAIAAPPRPAPVRLQTDVCVYGGTSAGIVAAVQVARLGQRCVLVSPDRRLGGMTSNGLGWTDIGSPGNVATLGGIAREFYHRVYLYYLNRSAWSAESRSQYVRRCGFRVDDRHQLMFNFEPKVAAAIFDELLRQSNITLIHGRIRRPGGVVKQQGTIRQLLADDGSFVVCAREYIDASYEGDLLAEAGVRYVLGREGAARYHETLAGIRTALATKNQLPRGIDPYRIPGNPRSGLLPEVMKGPGGNDGQGDGRLQACCYRLCLTDVASNRLAIARPAGYREAQFELLLRAIRAGQTSHFLQLSPLPNRKTDSNNDGGISTDFIGGDYNLREGWNYVEAGYARRQTIELAHRAFEMGLLWTLQHDPRVPAQIRKSWSRWGLARDEFTANNHWPPVLYLREARRMIGEFVITEHDVNQEPGHVAPDPVALGAYNMDSHNVQRYVTPAGFVQNEGDVQVAPARGPYGISYRALVPRADEARNLIVPVCLSASHIAYGSIRMEPVFMMLGQSAGAAAVLALRENVPVQRVNYSKLSQILLAAGQVLHAPARPRGASRPDAASPPRN